MSCRALLPLLALLLCVACVAPPKSEPVAAEAGPSADPVASAAPAPVVEPPAAPVASASASAAPEPAPVAEAPLPKVSVENIGMHIGGGPNDAPTKDPIRKSVAPHFEAFQRCFAKAEAPPKHGTVSIDLRVDKAGGKAKIEKSRFTIDGADFKACVLGVFEAIAFLPPRGGTTNVSYSLGFTPSK